MRISELASRSGLSTASIKFYAREGLMPVGARTGYNQTDYDDSHLTRLRLIRALVEAGGLPLSAVRRVLDAIDDPELPLQAALGSAQHAIPRPVGEATPASVHSVRQLARSRGWTVHDDNPGIPLAASVLDGYDDVGRSDLAAALDGYAAAADLVAAADLDLVADSGDRDRMLETVVVGTVLGDRLLAGLRRMAQESLARRRFGVRPAHDTSEEPA